MCQARGDFLVECKVHGAHNVSRLLGRRLGALLPVDANKVGQGGTAGEQRGGLAAEEGPQHLFKQQRHGNTFDTADCGVRQLQRETMTGLIHIVVLSQFCLFLSLRITINDSNLFPSQLASARIWPHTIKVA